MTCCEFYLTKTSSEKFNDSASLQCHLEGEVATLYCVGICTVRKVRANGGKENPKFVKHGTVIEAKAGISRVAWPEEELPKVRG